MVTFQDFMIYLQNMGIVDVLLPFILIFTVVFAILQKIKIFGAESKRYNVMLALVIGLVVVLPHILNPSEYDAVSIMWRAFPNVAVFIIAIVALFLLIGLWTSKELKFGKGFRGWASLIAIVIVAGIFTYAAGWWGGRSLPSWLYWLNDPGTIALIVIIVVFVIVISYITGGDETKPKGESGWKRFIESLGGED